MRRYLDSLKYALYCMTHPLDGFWDLTHEKRGTMAAANTILVLTCLARLFSLQFTSFLFSVVYWPKLNIFLYIGSILLPFGLFVVGNWATTTLFDGKGTLKQVYIGTCYAITPYPLFTFPLVIISNFLTMEEGVLLTVLSVISLVWAGFLLIASMIQIHEYKLGKTIIFVLFTLLAMLIMIFIILLFFSMISSGFSYIISLIKEIMYRL